MVTDWREFLENLRRLPEGYSCGLYRGRRYGTTLEVSGKRTKLFAEELGGSDTISFNYYALESGPVLKPCEMPAQKVIDFVIDYRPCSPHVRRACDRLPRTISVDPRGVRGD